MVAREELSQSVTRHQTNKKMDRLPDEEDPAPISIGIGGIRADPIGLLSNCLLQVMGGRLSLYPSR